MPSASPSLTLPMFLFSATFYPLDTLPLFLQWIGWISPLWHATELGRWLSYGMPLEPWQAVLSVTYLLAMGVSPELFAIMSQVPHDEIRGLAREETRRLKLVNE